MAGRKGFHKDVINHALRRGFGEARIDGAMVKLAEGMSLSRYYEHTIDIVIGRIPADDIEHLVAAALDVGNGTSMLLDENGQEAVFSVKKVCPSCASGHGIWTHDCFPLTAHRAPVLPAMAWDITGKLIRFL